LRFALIAGPLLARIHAPLLPPFRTSGLLSLGQRSLAGTGSRRHSFACAGTPDPGKVDVDVGAYAEAGCHLTIEGGNQMGDVLMLGPAASRVGVSRLRLQGMCDRAEIPFHWSGRYRVVKVSDLDRIRQKARELGYYQPDEAGVIEAV